MSTSPSSSRLRRLEGQEGQGGQGRRTGKRRVGRPLVRTGVPCDGSLPCSALLSERAAVLSGRRELTLDADSAQKACFLNFLEAAGEGNEWGERQE